MTELRLPALPLGSNQNSSCNVLRALEPICRADTPTGSPAASRQSVVVCIEWGVHPAPGMLCCTPTDSWVAAPRRRWLYLESVAHFVDPRENGSHVSCLAIHHAQQWADRSPMEPPMRYGPREHSPAQEATHGTSVPAESASAQTSHHSDSKTTGRHRL
jgi:hypothetical protein